jgi:hypothetical protein
MEICPVDRAVLEVALTSGLRDFEDAVQVACAIAQSLDAIVTRDTQDFSNAIVPVLSVIPILPKMATDERIRFNEMKDEQCQGYIN